MIPRKDAAIYMITAQCQENQVILKAFKQGNDGVFQPYYL